MICSSNEITSVVYKAAVGSGVAVGVAQDIAAAAVQLCAEGKRGVALVLECLEFDLANWCASLDLLAANATNEVTVPDPVNLEVLRSLAIIAGHNYEVGFDLQLANEGVSITRNAGHFPRPAPAGPVEVDESDLALAHELAHKTYVPATDESRIKGAGAGLTDND